MQIGKTPPSWAPINGDIISGENYKEFVIFMCDELSDGKVRVMGRLLKDINKPDPGIAAFYILENEFKVVGKHIFKE